ncbi:MAG: hypothetical protein JW863_18290 [Chitinispirillaceae bacterium]|nr:hypothetical protein [Chitinispirillaceae bacterium]
MRPLLLQLVILTVAFLVLDCGAPKEGSATKKAVEDVTGMTTLKQGEMMKKRLKDFEKSQEEHQKEINEIE